MLIKPTVGRRVWYRPHASERIEPHAQPFDAGIVYVHDDTCVNLAVTNELGRPVPDKTFIVLRQTWDEAAPGECAWMPYQQGQAKAAAEPLLSPNI